VWTVLFRESHMALTHRCVLSAAQPVLVPSPAATSGGNFWSRAAYNLRSADWMPDLRSVEGVGQGGFA